MDLKLSLSQRQVEVQGAFGYKMEFELIHDDEDETPFDITGATSAKFYAVNLVDELTKYSGAMVIDNATLGYVSYTVAVTDFLIAGKYKGEIHVIFPTKELKWVEIDITCLKSIGTP